MGGKGSKDDKDDKANESKPKGNETANNKQPGQDDNASGVNAADSTPQGTPPASGGTPPQSNTPPGPGGGKQVNMLQKLEALKTQEADKKREAEAAAAQANGTKKELETVSANVKELQTQIGGIADIVTKYKDEHPKLKTQLDALVRQYDSAKATIDKDSVKDDVQKIKQAYEKATSTLKTSLCTLDAQGTRNAPPGSVLEADLEVTKKAETSTAANSTYEDLVNLNKRVDEKLKESKAEGEKMQKAIEKNANLIAMYHLLELEAGLDAIDGGNRAGVKTPPAGILIAPDQFESELKAALVAMVDAKSTLLVKQTELAKRKADQKQKQDELENLTKNQKVNLLAQITAQG